MTLTDVRGVQIKLPRRRMKERIAYLDLPNRLAFVIDWSALTSGTHQSVRCRYLEHDVKVCIHADETIEGKVL